MKSRHTCDSRNAASTTWSAATRCRTFARRGKLLFPKAQIDAWLEAKSGAPIVASSAAPPIIAGSHDPLLEWAVRDSRCGLAILACGSSAGLDRLARGEATVAAMHWLDAASDEYNMPLVRERMGTAQLVGIEWGRRVQGLLLAAGNPLGIMTLADLATKRVRIAPRQAEAGSQHLFVHLLARANIPHRELHWLRALAWRRQTSPRQFATAMPMPAWASRPQHALRVSRSSRSPSSAWTSSCTAAIISSRRSRRCRPSCARRNSPPKRKRWGL